MIFNELLELDRFVVGSDYDQVSRVSSPASEIAEKAPDRNLLYDQKRCHDENKNDVERPTVLQSVKEKYKCGD
jgi:hypothetical protein